MKLRDQVADPRQEGLDAMLVTGVLVLAGLFFVPWLREYGIVVILFAGVAAAAGACLLKQ